MFFSCFRIDVCKPQFLWRNQMNGYPEFASMAWSFYIAAAAIGKIPVSFRRLGVQALTLSGLTSANTVYDGTTTESTRTLKNSQIARPAAIVGSAISTPDSAVSPAAMSDDATPGTTGAPSGPSLTARNPASACTAMS